MKRTITTSKEAWQQIEICCTTLCNKEVVMNYIRDVEDENEMLRREVNELRNQLIRIGQSNE